MKRRYIKILIVLVVIVLVSTFVLAVRPNVMPDKAKNPVVIPAHAVEVVPGVFYLGKAIDKGRVVEGYAFVKYKKGFGKPPWAGQGKDGEDKCYAFLAKGAKWKNVEDYMVDPKNIRGLDEAFVRNNLATDIQKWETAAGADILGEEIEGTVDGADLVSPDNKNEVYFTDITGKDSEGVIAVAIVWGYFSGNPAWRKLVEWDMIFDDVDFNWSDSGEAGKMDFENIATHELGHAVGLADLYNSECSEQTMYGYSNYGETKKRILEFGDITGIRKLYSI
jgi:hypothetical protein